MLLSQQMYNPQAYNYLANMWTNYQQNPNFTGGLQSLVANDGQPHINNMIPMKLPENGQNFNNNGNGSNSANTIGLKPVVENPSTL